MPARWIITALVCALLCPLAASAREPMEQEPAAPLRLAMSGSFRPFSTTDVHGELVGFDADIAREVARRLGRECILVQVDWAGIQAALQSRKVDLICSSMAVTAQRLETMHFTLPYYVSGAQVFARPHVTSLEGIRIGVTEASTYADYIAANPERFPDCRVVHYGSESEIVAAMNTDKIDAFVSDLIVGGFYIAQGGAGDIAPFGGLLYHEACAIAARKDSGGLVREVNAALFAMVQDGTYSRLYADWVGRAPDRQLLLATWGEHLRHVPAPSPTGATGSTPTATYATGMEEMLPLLGAGALLTIELSALTALLALLLGGLIGVGTCARRAALRRLADGYVGLVRGTPLLVQLFISYFVLATIVNQLVGTELVGAFGAALIALVINTAAYNAETIRGGIRAVDRGQWDAAASLGMPRPLILRRVILPQALRDSLPSLGNNLVVLIKDTSLVGAITLVELTYAARGVVFQTGQAFLPLFLAAGFYLVIIASVSAAMSAWERHLQRSRQQVGVTL